MLLVSKVANFAIDLPDADVAIQISGTYGSRQEEAQRLGRILRPKPGHNRAWFFSLVTADTKRRTLRPESQALPPRAGLPIPGAQGRRGDRGHGRGRGLGAPPYRGRRQHSRRARRPGSSESLTPWAPTNARVSRGASPPSSRKCPRASPCAPSSRPACPKRSPWRFRRASASSLVHQETLDLRKRFDAEAASSLAPATWRFIGHLQSNKVRDLIPAVDAVDTLDRLKIAAALDRRAGELGRVLPVLVEVNSGREPQKSGVFPKRSPSSSAPSRPSRTSRSRGS